MSSGVSVIICTYNGKGRLAPTLEHLARQDVGQTLDIELIIVDNNSTDYTIEWCREWLRSNAFPFSWHIVSEPSAGLSYARKKGISCAKYEFILFCDDDNHLSASYLKIGAKLLRQYPEWAVLGGHGEPLFENAPPDWFDRFHYSYAVGPQAEASGVLPRGAELYGAACFFRKIALDKLYTTGFTSSLTDRKGKALSSGGDVELCYALQLIGYSIAYEETLRFKHFMPASRLCMDYYLKLKKAIASQAGLLFVYQYLLKNDKPCLTLFYFDYIRAMTYTFVLLVGSRFKHILGLRRAPFMEKKVAQTVLNAKSRAFVGNLGKVQALFKELSKLSAVHRELLSI